MKMNAKLVASLMLVCTVFACFVLTERHISTQARVLRDAESKVTEARETLKRLRDQIKAQEIEGREKLARLQSDIQGKEMDYQIASANIETLRRNLTSDPPNFVNTLLSAKQDFSDIQHRVENGEFAGLASTSGYMKLIKVFGDSDFEKSLKKTVQDINQRMLERTDRFEPINR